MMTLTVRQILPTLRRAWLLQPGSRDMGSSVSDMGPNPMMVIMWNGVRKPFF